MRRIAFTMLTIVGLQAQQLAPPVPIRVEFKCGAKATVTHRPSVPPRVTSPGTDAHVDFFDCSGRHVLKARPGDQAVAVKHLRLGSAGTEALLVSVVGDSAIAKHTEVWAIGKDGRPRSVLAQQAIFVSIEPGPNGTASAVVLAVFRAGEYAVDDMWVETKFVWNSGSGTFSRSLH